MNKVAQRLALPSVRKLLSVNGPAISRKCMAHHESSDEAITTLDDLPVPQGSWQADYDAKQKKYNLHLIAGVVFAATSIIVAKTSGLIDLNATIPELKKE